MKITVQRILELIDTLDKGVPFDYVRPGSNKASLVSVDFGKKEILAERVSDNGAKQSVKFIESNLELIENGVTENKPFSIDKIFNNGGNARSVIEALLARTSEFYGCWIEGHKNLVWIPSRPHKVGETSVLEAEDIPELPHGKSAETQQIIYYGAPGTSKSWYVDNKIVKVHKTFRVTFHPDTDYASFVGCYKPETKEIEENGEKTEKIVYGFHKQVFLEAYIYAWTHLDEQVFLVIEEINRGNCAQIFGDIFQLLDRREDGHSKYTINADTDIARALREIPDYDKKFIKAYPDVKDQWEDNLMALPSNLSIIATMNTSDQSLYQMDSAFKRRWDMVYFPIKYDDADKAVVDLGNGKRYKWGDVLRVLNDYIKEETESSNKCIGNRFIDFERTGNKIDSRAFRDKVLFYLFTDVFKDSMDFAKDFFGEEKFGKGYKFFEDLCEHEKEGPAIIADFLQRHGLTAMPGSDEESASAPDASASETGSTSATSTDSEA